MQISKQKIELLQARKRLSGTVFAERAGLSRQSLSTMKRRGTCSPISAAKLATGLGVDVSEILTMPA